MSESNLTHYRLTFYTRSLTTNELKVYTYYWESAEKNHVIVKVRSNYIEFYSLNCGDVPQFADGVMTHRKKSWRVYDIKEERMVTRFTPVMLRTIDPVAEKEDFQIEYNHLSEKAVDEDGGVFKIGE